MSFWTFWILCHVNSLPTPKNKNQTKNPLNISPSLPLTHTNVTKKLQDRMGENASIWQGLVPRIYQEFLVRIYRVYVGHFHPWPAPNQRGQAAPGTPKLAPSLWPLAGSQPPAPTQLPWPAGSGWMGRGASRPAAHTQRPCKSNWSCKRRIVTKFTSVETMEG